MCATLGLSTIGDSVPSKSSATTSRRPARTTAAYSSAPDGEQNSMALLNQTRSGRGSGVVGGEDDVEPLGAQVVGGEQRLGLDAEVGREQLRRGLQARSVVDRAL